MKTIFIALTIQFALFAQSVFPPPSRLTCSNGTCTLPSGSNLSVGTTVLPLGTVDVRAKGAYGDTIVVSDAALNVVTNNKRLSSASAGFTAAHSGKTVILSGAGVAGAALTTTIATVVNATTVDLTDAATTTVSSARLVLVVHDDTAAFTAAISAGQAVYVPPGYYSITGITLGLQTTLFGDSRDGTHLVFTPVSGDGIVFPSTANRVILRDFTLEAAEKSTGRGVVSTGIAREPQVRNIQVANFNIGLEFAAPMAGVIDSCRFTGNGKAISGSIGILLGTVAPAARQGTTMTVSSTYVEAYETDIYTSTNNLALIRPVLEVAINGLRTRHTTTIIESWIMADTWDVDILSGGSVLALGYNSDQAKIQYGDSTALLGTSIIPSIVGSREAKIGAISWANDITFSPGADRSINVGRRTVGSAAGNYLALKAGAPKSGETDLNGGTLYLNSGPSIGTGTSKIVFNTASAGSSGTSDNAVTPKWTMLGSGYFGTPATPLYPFDVTTTKVGDFAAHFKNLSATGGAAVFSPGADAYYGLRVMNAAENVAVFGVTGANIILSTLAGCAAGQTAPLSINENKVLVQGTCVP